MELRKTNHWLIKNNPNGKYHYQKKFKEQITEEEAKKYKLIETKESICYIDKIYTEK